MTAPPVEYPFAKTVKLPDALRAQLNARFGNISLGLNSSDAEHISVYMTRELTADELTALNMIIADYTDPSYWLELDHTENHSLRSITTNETSCQTFLDTFIIAPYAHDNVVMGSMKTVVRCTTPDPSWVSSWNAATSPISVEVCVHCGTTGRDISSNSMDISADIDAAWRPMVAAGSNTVPPLYKSIQLYGFKDASPNSDCIWHLTGSVSDSNVCIDLNGLQKLFYQVVMPL